MHHLWLVWWNFRQLPQTMAVWALMFGSTVLFVFHGMRLWAQQAAKEVTVRTQWPFLLAYVVYLLALFFFPLKFLFSAQLNCACSFVITCENVSSFCFLHISVVFRPVWR